MAGSKKVSKTYSVEEDIFKQFQLITEKKFLNASRLIENFIKQYIEENSEDSEEKQPSNKIKAETL